MVSGVLGNINSDLSILTSRLDTFLNSDSTESKLGNNIRYTNITISAK